MAVESPHTRSAPNLRHVRTGYVLRAALACCFRRGDRSAQRHLLMARFESKLSGATGVSGAARANGSREGAIARLLQNSNARAGRLRWVDPTNGRVRIPIERAMQILVAEGPGLCSACARAGADGAHEAGAERLQPRRRRRLPVSPPQPRP